MEMKNIDILIELLEKKSLTPDEKKQFNSILETDQEAAKFFSVYNGLEKAAKTEVTLDDLSNYVLYKNSIEPEEKSFYNKIPAIEAKLRESEEFAEEFKILNSELNDISSFLSREIARPEQEAEAPVVTKQKLYTARYAWASVFAIGFIYLLLFGLSYLTTPDYYRYTSIDDEADFYVTRGRASEDFQNSLKAFEESNYTEAIKYLKIDIEKNPDDETIFYNHYIMGLAYLEDAEKSFIGLFPSYNENKASQALSNFEAAIEKNQSGKFENINLDAYFYSAKANLMLGNTGAAKSYLQQVINEKGSKMDEAKEILSVLE